MMLRPGMLAALLAGLALASCSTAPPQPARLHQAQQLAAQGEPRSRVDGIPDEHSLDALLKAQRIYQATDRGEERGRMEVAIAAWYLREGDSANAALWARRTTDAQDVGAATQAQAWARLAQVGLQRGQPDEAASAMNHVAPLCPACSQQAAYRVLDGRIHLAQQRPTEALDDAAAALRPGLPDAVAASTTADAHRLQGEAYLALRDFASARRALDAAYALDYAAARAERIWIDLDLLAQAYRGLGDAAHADDASRRAALARSAVLGTSVAPVPVPAPVAGQP